MLLQIFTYIFKRVWYMTTTTEKMLFVLDTFRLSYKQEFEYLNIAIRHR